MNRYKIGSAALVFFICSSVSGLATAAFSSVFFIGDSLSDNGNAKILLGTNTTDPWPLIPTFPYSPSDTYTNGPAWTDQFATSLGLATTPSLAGGLTGTNGAVAGARSGLRPNVLLPFYGIDQADAWINFFGGTIPLGSLWSVWVGGNDVRDASMTASLAVAEAIVDSAVDNIETIITNLHNAGATDFLVPNVSDIGATPEAATGAYAQDGSALTDRFNAGLAARIALLENTLGVNIFALDIHSAFDAILANPALFGYTNVTDSCLEIGGAGICGEPDEYAYWDGIHPTAAVHAGIADIAFAAVVPLPAAFPLLLSALGWIAWRHRISKS